MCRGPEEVPTVFVDYKCNLDMVCVVHISPDLSWDPKGTHQKRGAKNL